MAKQNINNPYPMVDSDRMYALWKRILSNDDTDEIHELYCKYVKPGAPRPISNCNCLLSVSTYYDELRDWHLKNTGLFS